MCGIGGRTSLSYEPVPALSASLDVMSRLLAHRGPDGRGKWCSEDERVGLVHRRLAIIDLSESAAQPMIAPGGRVIVYNGEIYNHPELRRALAQGWEFRSSSDTECILAAYDRFGDACVDHLRGMFAFALWDEPRGRLFCARDRFGIKPFYYAVVDGVFHFASEAKALLPFLPAIRTDDEALAEYFTFQYTLGDKTLFEGIRQLMPGHALVVEDGHVRTWRYWDVRDKADADCSAADARVKLRELMEESVALHGRADVAVGSYVSGGFDSSLVYALANAAGVASPLGFHGRFVEHPGYDESAYAYAVAAENLHCIDICAADFRRSIDAVIYHLDFPVAGPGSFPQYMVSQLAGRYVKVVLGGQGGDEIFGGYARYLVAALERSMLAAIDGDSQSDITLASIAPNLGLLREYKPMLKEFWRDGLFASFSERYLRLIDRSADMQDVIDRAVLDRRRVFESYIGIFDGASKARKDSHFDDMMRFDLKCLLPALLHVEDRMSMAHGLESRVPFLDHSLVEFVVALPVNVKLAGGELKHLLKRTFAGDLPDVVVDRRDKMGFPVPLKEWFDGELKEFVMDVVHTTVSRRRPYVDVRALLSSFNTGSRFSRRIWCLLSLELWHQQFHDRAADWRMPRM
jgi:asparagine synthase (glutamine-hydrolysing)